MTKLKKQTWQFGDSCEILAANFLQKQGYEILSRRFKVKVGEVDIIALKGTQLVFVEVKARKTKELIEVILRPAQVARIKAAASSFIGKNQQYWDFDVRFDFILFLGENKIPEHFEGYF